VLLESLGNNVRPVCPIQLLFRSVFNSNEKKENFDVTLVFVEPSGVQALKNSNPLKDVEALAMLGVAVLV